jgi:hypothetical protein
MRHRRNRETLLSDSLKSPAVPYDLSEAAIKELYTEAEPRKTRIDPDLAAGLRRSDESLQRDDSRAARQAAASNPLLAPIPEPASARKEDRIVGRGVSRRRRPRFRAFRICAVALIAAVLLATGLLHADQIRALLASYLPLRPPSINGTLRAADLAAGHGLNPGETYEIDVPPGTAQIAVVSGRVALVTKEGAIARPCSRQPFTLEPVDRSIPLVSACGGKASFIQAVIPQPPLPSALPDDASTAAPP